MFFPHIGHLEAGSSPTDSQPHPPVYPQNLQRSTGPTSPVHPQPPDQISLLCSLAFVVVLCTVI